MLKKIRKYINEKPKELTDYISDISDEDANYYINKFERIRLIMSRLYLFLFFAVCVYVYFFYPNISPFRFLIKNSFCGFVNLVYKSTFFVFYWLAYLTEPDLCDSKNIKEDTAKK